MIIASTCKQMTLVSRRYQKKMEAKALAFIRTKKNRKEKEKSLYNVF